MSENQEVVLTVGKPVIPADYLTFKDATYGERHFVRNGEGYDEVTKDPVEPIRVHADRQYIMHESVAFVDAVEEYGNKDTGIIFFELLSDLPGIAGAVTMFFDQSSRKEKITLPLARSLEFRSFLNGKEKMFSQKDFLKLIDTFPECIEIDSSNVNVFRAMVEKLQLSTKIDFESNADPRNLTFIYQERSGGDQTGSIPKKITLVLPYFEGSGNKVVIDADLEVTTPKNEGEKPSFKLGNVKHERTEREALKMEIDSLQSKLAGWLFVNGKY